MSWSDVLGTGRNAIVIGLDIAGAFDRVWHGGLLSKFTSLGISGDLHTPLRDHLQGRTLSVVKDHQSKQCPIKASVPQGSVPGPILWNVFINDLLQLVPGVTAYADDCTLSVSYEKEESQAAIAQVNTALELIETWGHDGNPHLQQKNLKL
ncbi:hypothetical protein C7M84_022575 [Penaeus vannamei]|uniref:Reverse transcriptase domain-containing protein n=1 Tax=Penaeus vannamei TaxID=6689 RepID=A0A423U6A8_PENVA|nr:hypothetical protein C7M84_022575 [Penaeus vannamei]